YLVLADWLMQQGHPRGELIALQHRFEAGVGQRERELRAELFPGEVRVSPEWRWGFVRELAASAVDVSVDQLEELLRHPSCRFLQRLRAHAVTEVILRAGSPSLRWLHLTTYGEVVELPALAEALPRLRHLAL